jgi:hypothetical protein
MPGGRDVCWGWQDLGGTGLVRAVRPAGHRVLDRDGLPVQGVQGVWGVEQFRLVVLDGGEDVVGVLVFGQVAGGSPLGVHRVQGDRRTAQVHLIQQRLDLG